MTSLSKEKYEDLNKSKANAWAIWVPLFKKSSNRHERFSHNEIKHYLKPNIILLGLNPSRNLEKYDLINFHNPKSPNDRKLKETIQGDSWTDPTCKNIFGGFMTDMVLKKYIPDSSKIDINEINLNQFEETLRQLGQSTYHLICFGNKVYNAVQCWLLHEETHDSGLLSGYREKKEWDLYLYKVVHFAASGKKSIFQGQMKELNRLLSDA